jgi:hypothetical protein
VSIAADAYGRAQQELFLVGVQADARLGGAVSTLSRGAGFVSGGSVTNFAASPEEIIT